MDDLFYEEASDISLPYSTDDSSDDLSGDELHLVKPPTHSFDGSSNGHRVIVDPFAYVSHVYFYFNRDTYNLMIRVLQEDLSNIIGSSQKV